MNAAVSLTPSIITALGDRKQFIVYRKTDKTPINPMTLHDMNGQDSANWMTGQFAKQWADHLGAEYGVGIVLYNGCGIGCVDLDKSHADGKWSALAMQLFARFNGAYIEYSQSGTGAHIFFSFRGPIVPHRKKNTALSIEYYDELRFIGLTGVGEVGNVLFDATDLLPQFLADYFPPAETVESANWTDAPLWHVPGTADDAALLEKARRSKSARAIFGDAVSTADLLDKDAAKLAKQWPGSTDGYDASSADQSLANRLVWWTGGDCARTERLMRGSALAVGREHKWDRLLRGTILNALALVAKNPPTAPVTAGTGVDELAGIAGVVLPDPTAPKKKTPPPSPAATQDDPRAVILLSGGKFDQYAAEAERLIADTIYVRGDNLVRIARAAEDSQAVRVVDERTGAELYKDQSGIKREAAQAVCIPASGGWMRRELMKRAQFWKYDKRSNEWEPKDCPKELAENIADQKAWAMFKPLVTISPVPFLRSDLSVCQEPGYDRASGIYYQPTLSFPPIIPAPTRADALEALNRLWHPFDQFPFASPESAAVFLAHLISGALRASFDTSPVFFYTAPMAATGKTLLASIPSLIAHGSKSPQHPYSEKEELRKVLFSSLLAGDAALTLDNVPNGIKVRAPVLCGFATSANWSDRVLGASENRALPNRCIVTLTGNNVTPVSDMARRSIVCRLDVNAETARGRKFKIRDLTGYVGARRAQLIVDAITIVRAYAFAGYPDVAHPLESFEQWSHLVRDPLVWLGMADAVASQLTETEDEIAPLSGAFTAIAAATENLGRTFTAAQLAPLLGAMAPGIVAPADTPATLRDAIVNAGCAEPSDPVKLGYWLRENKDRVGGGWKLVRAKNTHANVAKWQLTTIPGDTGMPEMITVVATKSGK